MKQRRRPDPSMFIDLCFEPPTGITKPVSIFLMVQGQLVSAQSWVKVALGSKVPPVLAKPVFREYRLRHSVRYSLLPCRQSSSSAGPFDRGILPLRHASCHSFGWTGPFQQCRVCVKDSPVIEGWICVVYLARSMKCPCPRSEDYSIRRQGSHGH